MLYPDATYRSHFGVYALILNKKKDQVLLVKKALGCYTGLLDLPGGSMEPHELLEETLFREVHEETGCHIKSCAQLGMFSILYPHTEGGKKHVLRHLASVYTATVTGTPIASSDAGDDSHGALWVDISSLNKKNAVPFVLQALQKVEQPDAAA